MSQTQQLNLFTSKVCSHCGKGGIHPKNPSLWNGFLDQDTGELVCPACRSLHYAKKASSMGTVEKTPEGYKITGMTYSEFPVML